MQTFYNYLCDYVYFNKFVSYSILNTKIEQALFTKMRSFGVRKGNTPLVAQKFVERENSGKAFSVPCLLSLEKILNRVWHGWSRKKRLINGRFVVGFSETQGDFYDEAGNSL